MGLLDRFFGNKQEYPPLEQSAAVAKQLESFRSPLEKLAEEVRDPLEVVPSSNSAYIIIGKPPKKFGVAWIEDGDQIIHLKNVLDKKKLSPTHIGRLSEQLKNVYIQHQEKPRYTAKIKDRKIVVTPSASLLNKLQTIVKENVG